MWDIGAALLRSRTSESDGETLEIAAGTFHGG